MSLRYCYGSVSKNILSLNDNRQLQFMVRKSYQSLLMSVLWRSVCVYTPWARHLYIVRDFVTWGLPFIARITWPYGNFYPAVLSTLRSPPPYGHLHSSTLFYPTVFSTLRPPLPYGRFLPTVTSTFLPQGKWDQIIPPVVAIASSTLRFLPLSPCGHFQPYGSSTSKITFHCDHF